MLLCWKCILLYLFTRHTNFPMFSSIWCHNIPVHIFHANIELHINVMYDSEVLLVSLLRLMLVWNDSTYLMLKLLHSNNVLIDKLLSSLLNTSTAMFWIPPVCIMFGCWNTNMHENIPFHRYKFGENVLSCMLMFLSSFLCLFFCIIFFRLADR